MDLGLRGRRALVTGSTAGIGFATAQALASEGAAVMVNGRTEARVATAVRAIRAAVSGAHLGGVAADLGTAEGCEILTQEVQRPAGADGLRGRGRLRPAPGPEPGDRFSDHGARVLRQREAQLAASPVCAAGGGGGHDRLHLQRASLGHQRRGAPGGWGGGEGGGLRPTTVGRSIYFTHHPRVTL